MGSSALMSIGTRAMFANYAALQTTGNNIANANTKGYSRQTVDLATSGGQFTGAGFFGKGVDVSTVRRAHDQFLTKEASVSRALASSDAARANQLNHLEKVFGTGESGLGHVSGQFLNAFVDVASRPQDLSARQVALARANDVATRFAAAGQQLDSIQAGVTTDIKGAVSSVNALAERIATLNGQIAAVKGAGHTPNDLMDQRDQAISDLGQYVQVSTVPSEDGSLNVFIGGGQRLVLSSIATKMVTVQDTFDPQLLRVGLQDAGTTRELSSDMLSGGSLSGLMRFQQTDLVDARNMLGQMANAISQAVNTQQSLGRDLSTPALPGGNIFQVGLPRVQAASTNTGSGQISVAITDASLAKASDYEVSFDGTSYQISRVGSTDAPMSVSIGQMSAGVQVQGLTIRLQGGNTQAGDRFLLQPQYAGARGMSMVLQDPKGLAAASPVLPTMPTTNTGTLAAGALTVKSPITDPAPTVMVRFDYQPATTSYTYSFSTDGGATYGAGTPLVPGRPIVYQATPGTTTWELATTGTPANGDTLTVGASNFTKANNGNANALVALRDALLIDGATITDRYADTLSQIGVRVQSANSSAELSQIVAEEAETARASQAGVNLDEEAARLMQFQQSYQAAAKMLQVAQSVFDTLLQSTGA